MEDTTIESDVEVVSAKCMCPWCTAEAEAAGGQRIPIPNPRLGCQRAIRKKNKGKAKAKAKPKAGARKPKAKAKSSLRKPAASPRSTSSRGRGDGGGDNPSNPSDASRNTLKPPFSMSKRNKTANRPGEAYVQQAQGGPGKRFSNNSRTIMEQVLCVDFFGDQRN